MEVILLENVVNLGRLGDRVKVRAGYGRNFLIPNRKALAATPDNVARFEAQRGELERAHAELLAQAEARGHELGDALVTIAVKAGNEGRLFGSVGPGDIADALTGAGHHVDKREVRMPQGPIRELGDHVVGLHLHPDVNIQITVRVMSEQQLAAREAAAEAGAVDDDGDDHDDADDDGI